MQIQEWRTQPLVLRTRYQIIPDAPAVAFLPLLAAQSVATSGVNLTMAERTESPLRNLPQVGDLLNSERGANLVSQHGHEEAKRAAREAIDGARRLILASLKSHTPTKTELIQSIGDSEALREAILDAAERWISDRKRPSQCRVINGTGVILHTSLGRAVIPPAAWAEAAEIARGYSLLELQRDSGKRGDRDEHVNGLICELTGAEAATVVNNNAAATWLILNQLAGAGGEVVISRAHMVEIGGSYRMPDVMRMSGAAMVEVGATNKCRARDYEQAITERTSCLLKVHTSNYRIEGFTEFASLEELVAIGQTRRVPVVYDLGAGALVDLRPHGLHDEPTVQELVATGADLVCLSGDKLLGGPQAGIIVGRADLIQAIKRNQMFRMLRCDKITLSLLEATLRLYRNPESAWQEVPTLRMISEPLGLVQARAEWLMLALSEALGTETELVEHEAFIGGGSLPTERLPSYAVRLAAGGHTCDSLATALRRGEPSVFGRIVHDQLLLDCRTIRDDDVAEIALAVSRLEREIE